LLGIFAETVALVTRNIGAVEVVIPAVEHFVDTIRGATAHWPVRPRIVVEAADKDAAFRVARAALAKSGTVTLELALAGVPMVAAYKITPIEYLLVGRGILKRLPSVILANLVLGETVVPQFLQHDCTAGRLAAALLPLIGDGAERQRQIEAFSRLDAVMGIGSLAPAARAADIVLGLARGGVQRGERAEV
jgi:lipid-A-disaccharide synthase